MSHEIYRKISTISAPNPKTQMLLDSACSCLCATYWSQVLSREWRCSWSSADRRCSNYIGVINNLMAYKGASYIRDLTVHMFLPEARFDLVCVCGVCVCVWRASVCASFTSLSARYTHHPFKLWWPNLGQVCKRPWLRSLLFCGAIDHDLQGKVLKNQNFIMPRFTTGVNAQLIE